MTYSDLPDVALSIQQPWAWLITYEFKTIENRDTLRNFRGPVAIHVGKRIDTSCAWDLGNGVHPVTMNNFDVRSLLPNEYPVGGIVAVGEIYDCVTESDDPWFVGKYGLKFRNVQPVNFIPVKGALGFFKWKDRVIA